MVSHAVKPCFSTWRFEGKLYIQNANSAFQIQNSKCKTGRVGEFQMVVNILFTFGYSSQTTTVTLQGGHSETALIVDKI